MLDLLITSYSTELELLRGTSRPEHHVEERERQIDQLVRNILPAIEATMSSGSFSRLECPALDCLLPKLLIGPVPPLPQVMVAFWEKIGSSEEEVRRSTSLSWRCKRLVAGDARIVAYLLASPVTAVLTDLNLGCNQIRDEGAAAIAEALSGNAVLTNLDLWNNNVGDEGSKALANALRVNGVLTTLDLSGEPYSSGGIGPEGASAIAEALKVNGVLTDLQLGVNQIGDEGAKELASALRVNGVLKTLDLSRNYIGDEGAKAIGAALRDNTVLTHLDLGWNKISDKGAEAIGGALAVNEVLKKITLQYQLQLRQKEIAG